MRATRPVSWAFAAVALVAAAPALADIALTPSPPVRGQEVTVTLTDEAGAPAAGVEVGVTYYPDSAIERTVVVGTSDSGGHVTFTPEHAGLVALAAGEAGAKTVGVYFDGMPVAGLVVFIIAGTLLFGGIVFGARKILQGEYVDPTT